VPEPKRIKLLVEKDIVDEVANDFVTHQQSGASNCSRPTKTVFKQKKGNVGKVGFSNQVFNMFSN
jgi:hypothetical protein